MFPELRKKQLTMFYSLFQAHFNEYQTVNIQTELDRKGNEGAAQHDPQLMDLMVLLIAKENLPVRLVESPYLMKVLRGEKSFVCI